MMNVNRNNQPINHALVLPDGATLNIVQWGSADANRPSCILLHGLDNNARVWDELAIRLVEKFTVYAIDFRGHGDSSWCKSVIYNIENFVKDVEFVRLNLNLETIYLVGHSLGGRVATSYTYQYSEHVTALVLGDVSIRMQSGVLEKMRKDCKNAPEYFLNIESYYRYLQEIYLLADKQALWKFAKHSLKNENGRYYNKTDPACRECILNVYPYNNDTNVISSIEVLLKKIELPTLLVKGAFSAVVNETDANKMLTRLSQGRLVEVGIAGHAIMIDNPLETVNAIESFFTECHQFSAVV